MESLEGTTLCYLPIFRFSAEWLKFNNRKHHGYCYTTGFYHEPRLVAWIHLTDGEKALVADIKREAMQGDAPETAP